MASHKEEIPTYDIPDDDEEFENYSEDDQFSASIEDEADKSEEGSLETEQRDNMNALSLSDLKATPVRQDLLGSLSPSRNLQERENIMVTEQRETEISYLTKPTEQQEEEQFPYQQHHSYAT